MSDAAPRDERLEALVVSHTHWDREWYLPAGRFRQRLVRLIDELLDAPSAPFLLDGQAIVLEDYLAVRPERGPLLRERLRDGSLEAGPWYVLADELIPGAESLIRNLLAGRRTLFALGAAPPPVLYSPDSFGHPAALPMLAREFGLLAVILWRGYGGARWPAGDAVRWRASDGESVLLFHLPRDGYELASNLPRDAEGARGRWARMRGELEPRSRTKLLLLLNGADHHARQLGLDDALDALRDAAAPVPVTRTTLRDFTLRLSHRASALELPVIEGELRDSHGYTWTLQGTFAARAHEKRRNAHAERLFVRKVEPWTALARVAGAPSARPLVEHAWKTLLGCHPHDTLCGCSTDEVARAMERRLDDVLAQGRGLRDDAVLSCVGHDAAVAREAKERWRSVVLVGNAAPRARGGVAELTVDAFIADEPVGPGSAPPASLATPARLALAGGMPMQVLRTGRARSRIDSPRHYPDNDLVAQHEVVAWLPPVPAYGIDAIELVAADARPAAPPVAARAEPGRIENDRLQLTIDDAGRVALSTRDGAIVLDDAIGFEDVGDAGDLYTHSPVGPVATHVEFRGARVVHRGPLRAEIVARWRMRVSASRVRGDGHLAARVASRARRAIPIELRFRLDAGAPFVRVLVAGENRARDHRLRIVFRTGLARSDVWADAAFGPVRRTALDVPEADARMERPVATAPLHRHVSIFTPARGVTLYSDGLAEYEATERGEIAVTLVRAVGELSRSDLPERPGHAGWPVATPEAQCLGPFAASFALMLHEGARTDATIDAIERAADDVLLPLAGETRRDAIELRSPMRGVALDGEGLAFSALKESEDGRSLVARCVNLLARETAGAWRFPFAPPEAWRARLDETPDGSLAIDGDTVRFLAGPRSVVTVLVRLPPATTDTHAGADQSSTADRRG
jgi:alpha-mannosidase